MSLPEIPLVTLDGNTISLGDFREKTMLVVNVASKCGHTPQYEQLEQIYRKYRDRGLVILGFPCNEFAGQEPGTAEDIRAFCTTNYDVTFPLFAKTKVNGNHAHPLYSLLSKTPDSSGEAGRIKWNFEKFVVSRKGNIFRFRSNVKPDAPELISVIEHELSAK